MRALALFNELHTDDIDWLLGAGSEQQGRTDRADELHQYGGSAAVQQQHLQLGCKQFVARNVSLVNHPLILHFNTH